MKQLSQYDIKLTELETTTNPSRPNKPIPSKGKDLSVHLSRRSSSEAHHNNQIARLVIVMKINAPEQCGLTVPLPPRGVCKKACVKYSALLQFLLQDFF